MTNTAETLTSHRGAPEVLKDVADSAHQTIDRLATQAAPHAEQLQQNLQSAAEAFDERADQLREASDAWVDSVRCSVRDHPLASIGVALAVGVLLARITR